MEANYLAKLYRYTVSFRIFFVVVVNFVINILWLRFFVKYIYRFVLLNVRFTYFNKFNAKLHVTENGPLAHLV